MKTKSVKFFIKHKSTANCDYIDKDETKNDITTLEAMGLLISRIAGTLQHSDTKNEVCDFEITITKRQ